MYEILKYVENDANTSIFLKFFLVNDDGEEEVFNSVRVSSTEVTIHKANAGSDITISSGNNVSWDELGKLSLKLGGLGLSNGDFMVSIKVFDSGHASGQYLIHRYGPYRLKVRING